MFTHAIRQALSRQGDLNHDGVVAVDELRRVVTKEVAERTAGQQNPTVDRDNLFVRFGFKP